MAEGAHVRGSLKLDEVHVHGGPDFALHLDEITVDTDLSARQLRCDGPLCLIGAQIGAVLDLVRSRVTHPEKAAVNLGGAQIGRSLLFGYSRIHGQLRMPGTADRRHGAVHRDADQRRARHRGSKAKA